MLHLMKYRGKITLNEKTTVFWSFIFAFILTTLMYMAFGGMSTTPDTMKTALVMENQGETAKALKSVLTMLENSEEKLIAVKEMTREEAEKKLEDDEISGIFIAGEQPELQVGENGLEQSILQVIMEQFQSRMNFISDVSREKPENQAAAMVSIMKNANAVYVEEGALGGEKPDPFVQYFFAVIAMTCLFGCYLGMDVATQLQGNVGAVGARRMVSSTSKIKMFFCDVGIAFVADFVVTILLMCYMRYVLKLEIGDDWPRMLLIAFVGCLMGVAIGVWVGSMTKISEGVKVGILTMTGLFSSFLSGLMISDIKGVLEQSCPVINRLNPASLITDALYSITMFPDHARFIRDIVTLAALALAFFGTAFYKMRRVRYDSI